MSGRQLALVAFLIAAAAAAIALYSTDSGGLMGRHGINPPKP